MINLAKKQRASLAAFFQSKFNKEAVSKLGFDSISEYFVFFAGLYNVKESSIRRRRDEFDYFFPNTRKGYSRNPTSTVKNLYNIFKKISDEDILKTLTKDIEKSKTQTKDIHTQKSNVIEIHKQDVECEYKKILKKQEMVLGSKRSIDFERELRSGGTIDTVKSKLISGARAESYFINFLVSKDFSNKEARICANDSSNAYDVELKTNNKNIGLEIKNIANGFFYLTLNEIILLSKNKTHLILVDIEKNIWLFKNENVHLKNILKETKKIHDEFNKKFDYFEITDIKVIINEKLREECVSLVDNSKEEIVNFMFNR